MTPVSLLANITVIIHVVGLIDDTISSTSTQPDVWEAGTKLTSVM